MFEIKHSKEIVPHQHYVLADGGQCEAVEKKFGKITGKFVLYRGEDREFANNIVYRDVEKYLKRITG